MVLSGLLKKLLNIQFIVIIIIIFIVYDIYECDEYISRCMCIDQRITLGCSFLPLC